MECPNCHKEITITSNKFNCPYCNQHINTEYDNIDAINSVDDATETPPKNNNVFNLHNRKFARFAVAILSVIILSVSGSFIYEHNKLTNLSDEHESLKSDYDDLEQDNSDLQEDYNTLSVKHDKTVETLENYKDQQVTIDDLNTKLTELQSKYDALEADRASILTQLDAKKAEEERVAQEQEAARQAQEIPNASAGTVYWVSSGSVYHSTPDCPTLKRSSNIHSGSKSDSGKSRACKVCN